MKRNWGPVLTILSGFGLCLVLVWTMQVMAVEYRKTQTTLEDFNAGDLFHTGLTREDDGEVRLLVMGIAGEWISNTNATNLPGLSRHCAVQHNDIIYVIGGRSAVAATEDEIYASTINTITHDLSNWSQIEVLPTSIYPSGIRLHGCVVLNDRLYILGGAAPSTTDKVAYAPLNSDGSLGTWIETMPLPAGRNNVEAVVLNGRIYVLGGVTSTVPQNQVWYAEPEPSGAITSWLTSTHSLPEAGYQGHSATVGNGRIYVTGGTDKVSPSPGEYLPYVDYADIITSTGEISGTWQRTTDLTANLFAHESIVLNGQLFVIAGAINNITNPSDYVGSALLDEDDGSIPLGWVDTSLVVPARFWHAVVSSSDGWLYVIGGSSGGNNPLTDHIVNRGATTGAGDFNYVEEGTFTSGIIELDNQFNRVVTGLSWSTTLTDTVPMGLAMSYRVARDGIWTGWQGPLYSESVAGTYTTTAHFKPGDVVGRQLQYKAALTTTVGGKATPVLNQVSILFDVPQPPQLAKSATPPNGSLVQPGDFITYSFTYQNLDATPLLGVVLTDFIPVSCTIVPASIVGPNPTIGPDFVQWDIGKLGTGETGIVSFAVQVAPDTPDSTVLTNIGLITAKDVGDRYSNQVQHIAGYFLYDLSVDKDNGEFVVDAGQNLTYTITYTNTNALGWIVGGVVLTETLDPAGYLTYVGTGWQEVSAGVFRYVVGDLPPDSPETVTFEVQVSPSIPLTFPTITNTVKIDADKVAGSEIDPANNISQDIDTLSSPEYDLQVSKDDGAYTAAPGQNLTYTITYAYYHDSGAAISGVVLTETLDPAEYLTYTGVGWEAVSPGVYRYTIANLPANTPQSIPFEVQVSPALPITTYLAITNTVEIDAEINEFETDLDNNQAQDIDTISGPDIAIASFSYSPAHPRVNEPLTVEVQVVNRGLFTATGPIWIELYAKDSAFVPAGPPAGPWDHLGGYCAPPGCTDRMEYLKAIAWLPLLPPEGETVTFTITPTIESEYTLYAQADVSFYGQPKGQVIEGNETNNIAELLGVVVCLDCTAPVYLPLILR